MKSCTPIIVCLARVVAAPAATIAANGHGLIESLGVGLFYFTPLMMFYNFHGFILVASSQP